MVHYNIIDAPGHRDLIRAQIDDIPVPYDAAIRRPYADISALHHHRRCWPQSNHHEYDYRCITGYKNGDNEIARGEDETENGYLNDTQENKVTMYSETDGARYALEFEYTLSASILNKRVAQQICPS